jgi:hypothetical protein
LREMVNVIFIFVLWRLLYYFPTVPKFRSGHEPHFVVFLSLAILLSTTAQMWLLNLGIPIHMITRSMLCLIFIAAIVWISSLARVTLTSGLKGLLTRVNIYLIIDFTVMLALSFFLARQGVYENDLLEYVGVANQLSGQPKFGLFFDSYPLTETSWIQPLYAPSTHNPFFHTLLMMTLNSALPLESLFFTALLMVYMIVELSFGKKSRLFGYFIVLSVPLFSFAIVGFYVDIPRLALLASALYLLAHSPNIIPPVTLCIIFALTLSVHSLGIVCAFVISIIIVVQKRFEFSFPFIFKSLPLMILSISLFSPQYILNILRFGSPFQDSTPIMDLPEVRWELDLITRREIAEFGDRMLNGVFSPIFHFDLYGMIFLLSILLCILNLRAVSSAIFSRDLQLASVHLLFVLIYFAVNFVSAVLGMDSLIKNFRYQLTYLPSVLVLLTLYFRKLHCTERRIS